MSFVILCGYIWEEKYYTYYWDVKTKKFCIIKIFWINYGHKPLDKSTFFVATLAQLIP